jgi:hypothetical protein
VDSCRGTVRGLLGRKGSHRVRMDRKASRAEATAQSKHPHTVGDPCTHLGFQPVEVQPLWKRVKVGVEGKAGRAQGRAFPVEDIPRSTGMLLGGPQLSS